MQAREWIESGQRFRLDGCVIRSTKPAKLRLAYGDERLRQIREARAGDATPPAAWRRLLSRVLQG